MLLEDYTYDLVNIFCLPSSTEFNAVVALGQDISPVLPFLNAVVRRGHYAHRERIFDFMHRGHIVTLEPREMKVTGLRDHDHAREVIEELRDLINRTWEQRDQLSPAFEHRKPPSALDVLRELPRTNCGACGLPTCLAFAAQVVADPDRLEQCPELANPDHAASHERLRRLLG